MNQSTLIDPTLQNKIQQPKLKVPLIKQINNQPSMSNTQILTNATATRNISLFNINTINTGSTLTFLNDQQQPIQDQLKDSQISFQNHSRVNDGLQTLTNDLFNTIQSTNSKIPPSIKLNKDLNGSNYDQIKQQTLMTPLLFAKNRSRVHSISKDKPGTIDMMTQDNKNEEYLIEKFEKMTKQLKIKKKKQQEINYLRSKSQGRNTVNPLRKNLQIADTMVKLLNNIDKSRCSRKFLLQTATSNFQTEDYSRPIVLNDYNDDYIDSYALQTDQLIEYSMVARPMTPLKSRPQSSAHNNQHYINQFISDQPLLNHNVIETEHFKAFLDYKANANDYRKPNEIFQQRLGQLNPFSSKSSRPQTASTNSYLSFLRTKASSKPRQSPTPTNQTQIYNNFSTLKQLKPLLYERNAQAKSPLKPLEQAIFDIPLWDLKSKQKALEQLKNRRDELKYKNYKGRVERVNEIKDYLWANRNVLKREQIMRLAILIDRMSQNIHRLEIKTQGIKKDNIVVSEGQKALGQSNGVQQQL